MAMNDVAVLPGDDGKMERVEGVEKTRTQNLVRLPFQVLFAWALKRHMRKA